MKDYIDELEEKRRVSKALESSRKAMTKNQSSAHSTISTLSTITATINSPDNKDSQESAVTEILDLEGNAINTNNQLGR